MAPNRSASWREVKLVLLVFSIVIFSIAIAWAFAGVWVVIPFAGVEFGLLGYLMYRVNWQAHQHQRLIITPFWLVLEQGFRQRQVIRLERADCQFTVTETESHWQLPIYIVYCHGEEYQLGPFLNLRDLKQLQHCLNQSGIGLCRNRWWES